MRMVSLDCPKCKGAISLDQDRKFGFCQYCGNQIMMVDDAQHNAQQTTGNAPTEESLLAYGYEMMDIDKASAQKQFDEVLRMNPKNYKAWEGLFLCNLAFLKNHYEFDRIKVNQTDGSCTLGFLKSLPTGKFGYRSEEIRSMREMVKNCIEFAPEEEKEKYHAYDEQYFLKPRRDLIDYHIVIWTQKARAISPQTIEIVEKYVGFDTKTTKSKYHVYIYLCITSMLATLASVAVMPIMVLGFLIILGLMINLLNKMPPFDKIEQARAVYPFTYEQLELWKALKVKEVS